MIFTIPENKINDLNKLCKIIPQEAVWSTEYVSFARIDGSLLSVINNILGGDVDGFYIKNNLNIDIFKVICLIEMNLIDIKFDRYDSLRVTQFLYGWVVVDNDMSGKEVVGELAFIHNAQVNVVKVFGKHLTN